MTEAEETLSRWCEDSKDLIQRMRESMAFFYEGGEKAEEVLLKLIKDDWFSRTHNHIKVGILSVPIELIIPEAREAFKAFHTKYKTENISADGISNLRKRQISRLCKHSYS